MHHARMTSLGLETLFVVYMESQLLGAQNQSLCSAPCSHSCCRDVRDRGARPGQRPPGAGDLQHAVPGVPGLCQLQCGGTPRRSGCWVVPVLSAGAAPGAAGTARCSSALWEDTVPRCFISDQRSHGECKCTQHSGTWEEVIFSLHTGGFFNMSSQQKKSSFNFAKKR